MRRVVITGQGAITALGHNAHQTLEAIREGICGVGELTFQDSERLSVRIGAQVKEFDPADHFNRQEIAFYDPFTQFALLAGKEAVAASGIVFEGALAERAGVILGTAGGGLQTQDQSYRAVYAEGKNRVHPFTVPRLMNNAAASHLSMRHGIRGPVYSVSSACASANHAMGQAFHMIRGGSCDAVLTGGSDSMLCFGGIKAWEGLKVLSTEACRPFCATRSGMVQGEGAAVFVFEDYEHATARGADILAEVVGFSMTSDAADIVLPAQDGAERAMRAALRDARLSPDDIDYLNAHGTGTRANDKSESAAINAVFGDHTRHLSVSSTKATHGHVMGGTGAVELLAVIMALRTGVIAPTIGFRQADPECAINLVANDAQEKPVKAALSNAFAFGGLNAVIALKRI